MRRRLVLLSLATTVLIVVAFVVPLALLVRTQARESARVSAERDAQSVAGLVALAVAVHDTPESVAAAIGTLPEGTIVVLGETIMGEPRPGQGSLASGAAANRRTVAGDVDGGWEIALPVVGVGRVAVVDSFVTSAELDEGVATAWLLLAMLALLLVGVGVWIADRLGRRLTAPIEDLARSAHQLAAGDLAARVTPSEPEELRETGEAFNYLADRLDDLLAEERESAADLSHRLRTPMTSLRLQAEALGDDEERAAMMAQVDRLERAMDQVIELARSRAVQRPSRCELDLVVGERCAFWRVLADEQGRVLSFEPGARDAVVPLAADDLGAVVDTLVGNVFSHTPVRADFAIRTGVSARGLTWLEVSDRGPGFTGGRSVERGASRSGSTGLGLDIARKAAEGTGGSVDIDNRPGGGAVVRVTFGAP